MHQLLDYLGAHKALWMWVSIASVVMFVGSLLAMPMIIARAPADYFTRERDPDQAPTHIVLKVLLNVVGAVLMLVGVAMLVLPGQGLLMMLLSLTLLDVPGKHKLVQRIAKKPPVWRALSYFRERAHKPPFEEPYG